MRDAMDEDEEEYGTTGLLRQEGSRPLVPSNHHHHFHFHRYLYRDAAIDTAVVR